MHTLKTMLSLMLAIGYWLVVVALAAIVHAHYDLDKSSLHQTEFYILAAIYFALSIRILPPQHVGAVVILGWPAYNVKPGPVFVPFIIGHVADFEGTVIHYDIPEEASLIRRSPDDTRPDAVDPIRVTTASYESLNVTDKIRADACGGKDEPLNTRLTIDVIGAVNLRINNPVCFLRNIGSMENLRKNAWDAFRNTVQNEYGTRTPALIIAENGTINTTLTNAMKERVKDNKKTPEDEDWGVEVISMLVTDNDITKRVNTSLANLAQARTDKMSTRTAAEAAAYKRDQEGLGEKDFETKRGAGLASARKAMLLAEAAGVINLAKAMKTDEGTAAMTLQTLRQMYEKAQYSVMPSDGIASMASTVTAAVEQFNKAKAKPPTT